MAKVLVSVSIPPRLRDGMMLKTGNAHGFDVPDTLEGAKFLTFWKTASAETRDAMMVRAYEEDVSIVDAIPVTEGDDA